MPVLSGKVVLELQRPDTCCRRAVERFLLLPHNKEVKISTRMLVSRAVISLPQGYVHSNIQFSFP